MQHLSFDSWLAHRTNTPHAIVPKADRVVPLVRASGRQGMTRYQLGAAVDLERDVLDELLDGLVRLGALEATDRSGVRTYWATGAW